VSSTSSAARSSPSSSPVGRDPGGATLNQFVIATILNNEETLGSPEKNDEATLGGVPARLLTYHANLPGGDFYVLDALAVSGKYGYELAWFSPAGREPADRARFELLLAWFAPTS